MTVQEIAQPVRLWAAGETLIRRVYLFGSRARGDSRPDSDIDLALVCRMDPKIRAEFDSDHWQARFWFWHVYGPAWQHQLSQRFSVPVDLQLLDQDAKHIVRPSVKRDGIRVA